MASLSSMADQFMVGSKASHRLDKAREVARARTGEKSRYIKSMSFNNTVKEGLFERFARDGLHRVWFTADSTAGWSDFQ